MPNYRIDYSRPEYGSITILARDADHATERFWDEDWDLDWDDSGSTEIDDTEEIDDEPYDEDEEDEGSEWPGDNKVILMQE